MGKGQVEVVGMNFGVMLPHFGPWASPQALVGTAQMVEGLGFDSVFTLDRLLAPVEAKTAYPGSPDGKLPTFMETLYEPLVALTWLASQTSRIKLGTGVLVSAFRSPVLLGRMVATLDQLSGGRVICGVGMGWSEDEYEASGVPFTQKGPRFDEYLEALRRIWTEETPGFEGRYYTVARSHVKPHPVQKPHPQLWIGGESDAAIRRAARFGTGWYASGYIAPDALRQRVSQLRELLRENGRSADDFRIGLWAGFGYTAEPSQPLVGPSEHVAASLRTFEAAGVTDVVLAAGMAGTDPAADLQRFAAEMLVRA